MTVAALLFVATGCHSAVNPSSPDPMNMPRVVVLGDSLAVSPTSQLNFTTELQARADAAAVRVRISNASIWGDTTADGLRRLDGALAIDPQILVVALGANDGLLGVSLPAIERNLDAIIRRARDRGIRVLLTGMEAPPLNGFDYSIQFHLLFPRLAARYDVPLVPFLLAGVILNPDMNGPDGSIRTPPARGGLPPRSGRISRRWSARSRQPRHDGGSRQRRFRRQRLIRSLRPLRVAVPKP